MPASNKTTFEVGSLTIAAAGTAQQLTAHRIPQGYYLTVHAHSGNAEGAYIYFGKTKAIAELHLATLEAGASAKIATDNVSDVWCDGATGAVVEWWHETDNADA